MTYIVVKSQIKDLVGELQVSGDFAEALDKKVKEIIKQAITRAKDNGRRTVMSKDL